MILEILPNIYDDMKTTEHMTVSGDYGPAGAAGVRLQVETKLQIQTQTVQNYRN